MKKIILILACAAFLTACSDFLLPSSQSEIIPDSAEALNELLLGEAYPKYSGYIYMDVFLGMLDDDVEHRQYVDESNITFPGMMTSIQAAYAWQSDMFSVFRLADFQSSIYNTWQNCYRGILGANAVLDYLDGVSGTVAEKNKVKGQALALRAFYYFQLANTYGAPYYHNKEGYAVPLKLDSYVSTEGMPQNTVAEVYERVLIDLHNAEELMLSLAESEQWKMDYRVSAPMVQLLLSRVYLYMEDWENAVKYGEKVLANSTFQLLDLNTLPTPELMNTAYYNFMNYYNNSEVIWLYGQIIDAFYMQVTMSTTNASTTDGSDKALFQASDDLMSMYDDDDLRPTQYIFDDFSKKYKVPMGKVRVDANRTTSSEGFARAFRLSEAYLNVAEACAMQNIAGDAAAGSRAVELMNSLRAKRFATGTAVALPTLSAEDLLEEVRNERRRELCFEGHRWFDLRRQGMPALEHVWHETETNTSTYTLEHNSASYTMGIPEEAIIQNPQLIH